jgi:hypothetical protein
MTRRPSEQARIARTVKTLADLGVHGARIKIDRDGDMTVEYGPTLEPQPEPDSWASWKAKKNARQDHGH